MTTTLEPVRLAIDLRGMGKTRRRILTLVAAGIYAGRQPSLVELAELCGVKSKNAVFGHTKALKRDGYLKSGSGVARCLELGPNFLWREMTCTAIAAGPALPCGSIPTPS